MRAPGSASYGYNGAASQGSSRTRTIETLDPRSSGQATAQDLDSIKLSGRLAALLHESPEAVLCLDREWCVTYANAEARRLGRLTDEHMFHRSFWDIYPDTVGTPLDSMYRRVVQTRVPEQTESFYAPFDMYFDIHASPTDDGVVLYFRDVTERKRKEEALVASVSRYRVLADLNPQAIWMGSADGRITYANQGFLEYIGLTMETIGGLGWLDAFSMDERERVVATWTTSVQTGVDYEVEAKMRRARDGSLRWWCLRASPVRDEAGTILHWLGVGIDLHDTKMAAEELRLKQLETERQRVELETVYQTAPVGLALFDPLEGRYLRLNERQAEILGMPSEQVLGRTLAEIAPLPSLEEMLKLAASGHPVKNQIVEGELASRPGEHRIWNVSHSPVYAADGSIRAITASWLEITHLKKAEAALIQSEKLAAVGRLASSISHEINNPLEAITNLLYLIALSEDLPPELKVYVHMAQSELARVSQIATQTLRFHRQAVKPTLVTAAELVDAVLNLYQGRLANSGIKVKSRYTTKTHVLCFENDIRQVLNNLIANAIDAMRTGGHLVVRAHDAVHFVSGRRGVRVAIADTGHGMTPTVLQRLFEPFYTTKDLNGTGLGLWISEGIVKRHQGRLSVRSTQDPVRHGTVFSLFLPCAETVEGAGSPQASA